MTRSSRVRGVLLVVVIALGLLNSGCFGGGPVNKGNFDKIKVDSMSLADVETVMGSKGQDVSGDMAKKLGVPEVPGVKIYRWGDENRYIIVTVALNKVKYKDAKGV
jgi:hypothetical protein